jgi:hypothetical protein
MRADSVPDASVTTAGPRRLSYPGVVATKDPVATGPALHTDKNARANGRIRVTPQARTYALWELARRAGVPPEFFRMWSIRTEPDRTIIEPLPGTQMQISFPHCSPGHLQRISEGVIRTFHMTWMTEPRPAVKKLAPDLIIPFAQEDKSPSGPLFVRMDPYHVECALDLPLSILLSLSRWEELIAEDRDVHGRFTAGQSVAVRDDFLRRPIVDEYGLAFEQVLMSLIPSWQPARRSLWTKMSHDADHVGMPFRWKNVVRHVTRYRAPGNSWRDLWSWMPGKEPVDLAAIRRIVQLSIEHKLDSAVYWMACSPGVYDSGYDPTHRKIREVIDWLRERGIECGVHPGYETFRSPAKLSREVNRLREVLGNEPLGGRQHYLRWCPDTWIHWETCGLVYDSTLGYADQVGFRAGTCVPFRPWLMSLNREAHLTEIPLVVMDRTLKDYMGLTDDQSLEAVRECVDRCRLVGGVFTMLWHNNTLLDPAYRSLYGSLLEQLSGAESYDWLSETKQRLHF